MKALHRRTIFFLTLCCLVGASVIFVLTRDTVGSPVAIPWGYPGFNRNPVRPIIAFSGELWDIQQRRKLHDFKPASAGSAWSPDGRYLAVAGATGVDIYDIDTQQRTRVLPWEGDTTELLIGYYEWSGSVVWSANGSLLAVRAIEMAYDKTGYRYPSDKNSIALYQMPEGRLIQQWHTTTEPLSYFAVSPDGAFVIVPSQCKGEVWSLEENRPIHALAIGLCGSQPAFSHDGHFLAGADGSDILLYDTRTWQQQLTLHGHSGNVNALEFSPDDTLLVSGAGIQWSSSNEPPTDTTARVWRVADRHLLTVFDGHRALSPRSRISPSPAQLQFC